MLRKVRTKMQMTETSMMVITQSAENERAMALWKKGRDGPMSLAQGGGYESINNHTERGERSRGARRRTLPKGQGRRHKVQAGEKDMGGGSARCDNHASSHFSQGGRMRKKVRKLIRNLERKAASRREIEDPQSGSKNTGEERGEENHLGQKKFGA